MNLRATVSVVKGLEPGDVDRIREGPIGAGVGEFVDKGRDIVLPSERRSLPTGSIGVTHE